jgi:hypothetical protein
MDDLESLTKLLITERIGKDASVQLPGLSLAISSAVAMCNYLRGRYFRISKNGTLFIKISAKLFFRHNLCRMLCMTFSARNLPPGF